MAGLRDSYPLYLANEAQTPNLDLEVDPQVSWALRHPAFFPVEVNRASYEEILRIPGVGVKSAQRIVRARKQTSLGFEELRRLGVVLKRAQYFVTCRGRSIHRGLYPEAILADLSPEKNLIRIGELREGQMSLFRSDQKLLPMELTQEI